MEGRTLRYLVTLIVLVLAQVLICNHIVIFNVAICFVFIYVVINLPMDLKTDWLLTWAFFGGLVVDLFSDTAGVNALACTTLAMVKKPCLYAYIPKDDRTKGIEPSLKNLGFSVYGKYLLSMSAIYCVLVFTIEYFNFAAVKDIVIMSVSSALLTFAVLLGVDSLTMSKREKRL